MNLQEELRKVEINSMEWACLHYLELEVNEDPNLVEAINNFPKGINEIFEYVISMAAKNQDKNRRFCDSGEKVFAWVKEYVIDYEAIDKKWSAGIKDNDDKQEEKQEVKVLKTEKPKVEKPKVEKTKKKVDTIDVNQCDMFAGMDFDFSVN